MRTSKLLPLVAVLVMGASASMAGSTAVGVDNDNVSLSGSSVNIEGSENTPGIAGSGSGSTAPCVISNFVGLGQPGFGLGVSIPYKDRTCAIMREVEFLNAMVNLRAQNPEAYRAAIYHACSNSRRLRKTLVEIGLCAMR